MRKRYGTWNYTLQLRERVKESRKDISVRLVNKLKHNYKTCIYVYETTCHTINGVLIHLLVQYTGEAVREEAEDEMKT